MYVKWGTFAFEPHECGLSVYVEAVRSSRGFQKTRKVTFDIEGEVCAADQYAVSTRLAQIQAALQINYQDIELLHDNDTRSEHYMLSAHPDNLSGNQVRVITFPQTTGAEYTSGRRFRFTVDAEFSAHESQVVEFFDSVSIRGNAGAQWRWSRNPQWGWFPELVSPNSLQVVSHEGYIVGATTRLPPVVPFFSGPFLDNLNSSHWYGSGKRHPQRITDMKTSWNYRYILPVDQSATIRPTLP